MRLKSSKTRAPPLETNIGLMSSRSFLDNSPTLGVRMAITGRSLLMASCSRSAGRKATRPIVEPGQGKVGLGDPAFPDGIVVVHAREGRFDVVARGLEGGGQESFDHFPYALRLRI